MTGLPGWAQWAAVSLGLILFAVLLRPPLPIDETRYLAVAWDMWLRHDFLVPYLNGEPYSHKPPLLFWGMQAGWLIFGVNDFTAALVAPLFGVAALFLTARLAGQLWPDVPEVTELVPWLLLGSVYWTLFSTLTMFDLMLAACALMALSGVASVWRHGGWRGWLVCGLGIGIGVLAKGPAILLSTLPAALLAPWWDRRKLIASRRSGWLRWYLGLLTALLLGAAIGLAWAIPAALAGGSEYREAILWGQTAGRVVDSFAHQRPWWFFLALLVPLLLPWSLAPQVWRAGWRCRRNAEQSGLRFCISWVVPALVVFSAISGKQPHYVLPLFPAFALVAARLLSGDHDSPRRWDGMVPGLVYLILGGVLTALPLAHLWFDDTSLWYSDLANRWGLVLVVVAILFMAFPPRRAAILVRAGAGLSVALVVALHLTVAPALAAAFDLRGFAHQLAQWQEAEQDIAHFGKYHGQFQFLGRLQRPLQELGHAELAPWLSAHPQALVVAFVDQLSQSETVPPLALQRFRSGFYVVYRATEVLNDPTLIER